MKKFCLYLIALCAACACTKNESGPHDEGPVEVALTARISSVVDVSTRAPFELKTPTPENSLTAAIWASSVAKTYFGAQKTEPGEDAKFIDFHDSTRFTSAERQLLDHRLFYPTDDGKGHEKPLVYFVGLCPKRGWAVEKCSTHKISDTLAWDVARYEFDGCSDVMFAPEVSNGLATSIECPQMHFRHILTWLKFNVVSDEDAIDAWGKVQYIKIVSHKILRIDVNDGVVTYDPSTSANIMDTYCFLKGKSTDQVFNSTASVNPSSSVELTTSPQEVAYVLCASRNAAPGNGSDEYEVIIKTEYRPETRVTVNLKDANGYDYTGNTSGKQFTVTFRFQLGDRVVTVARITEWDNGGIGVKKVEE